MLAQPETIAVPTFRKDFPAVDTAAVITLPADPEQVHVLDWVGYSYANDPDVAPEDGSLTVAIGGVDKWKIDITTLGLRQIDFPGGFYGEKNQEMIVTLAANTSATPTRGKLNIRTR